MPYISQSNYTNFRGELFPISSKPSGIYTQQLKSILSQLDIMLEKYSRVFVMRFDIRIFEQTIDNRVISQFNKPFHKWLKRHYKIKDIAFAWCREQEKAKKQHYHYILILDGKAVRHSSVIFEKIVELCQQQNLSPSLPENSFYNCHQNDHSILTDIIYRLSYLAKARGKGYKKEQVKNYSSSRVKP